MAENKRVFSCSNCNLTETYYPFELASSALTLIEDAYVMKDPFNDTIQPLILGSNCVVCGKCVCVSPDCSVFYMKRFCVQCFKTNLNEFPVELQKQVMLQSKDIQ